MVRIDYSLLTSEEQEIIEEFNEIKKKRDTLLNGYNTVIKKYNKLKRQQEKEKREEEYKLAEKIRQEKRDKEDKEKKEIYNNKLENFTSRYTNFKYKFYKNFEKLKKQRAEFEDTNELESTIKSDSIAFRKFCIHPKEFGSKITKRKYEECGGGQGISESYFKTDLCLLCYDDENINFANDIVYDKYFDKFLKDLMKIK